MNRVDPSAAAMVMATRPATAGWRLVLSVFKLRIGTLIMLTAIAGLAIVPDGGATPWQSLVLALSVLVASASAGAFNQYVEADSDRLMARTRTRAFASGALQRGPGWLVLMAAMLAGAVGAAAWWVNLPAALFVLLGALTYAVVYTGSEAPHAVEHRHRRGRRRLCGPGGRGGQPQVGPLGLLLALVLLLWTP